MVKQIPSYAPEPFERHKPAPVPVNNHAAIQKSGTTDFAEKEAIISSKSIFVESKVQTVSQYVAEKHPYSVVSKSESVGTDTETTVSPAGNSPSSEAGGNENKVVDSSVTKETKSVQLSFLSEEAKKEHRIIGQVFATYWMVEYNDKLYIIDQHAAHERILYENMMKARKLTEPNAQQLFPPLVISLNLREQEILEQALPYLEKLGYEIEPFGGKEYKVSAVPAELPSISKKEFLLEFLDSLSESGIPGEPESIYDKIASLSCKAAVKGNQKLSYDEASALINQLMKLENPFHCPHGRPVTIELSKYEIEKKFKRVL